MQPILSFVFRHLFVILASFLVILAAALSYHFAAPPESGHKTVAAAKAAPPTTTSTEPVEIFQKAFWKRPTANDKILHAERREWADAGGVKKWQWFIAVQPSPELVKHLREDNAFNLVHATAADPIEGGPSWFSFDSKGADILQSPLGGMRLIFSQTGNVLYATDSGGGFHAGAPEAPRPLPATVATSRLPLTPPPNPTRP